MPVNSTHPKYDKFLPQWVRQRDAIEGGDAVKARATTHLPKLESHTRDVIHGQSDYDAYLRRALFYGAADRTVKALIGFLLGKPAEIEFPGSAEEFEKRKIGTRGETFAQLSQTAASELTGLGRVAILTDLPEGAEAARASFYYAENVINWLEGKINGELVPIEIVLKEVGFKPKDNDPFVRVEFTRYRVLRLGVPPLGFEESSEERMRRLAITTEDLEQVQEGVYYQELWEKEEDVADSGQEESEGWVLLKTTIPRKKGGQLFDYIPFRICNPENCEIDPSKGALLDMIDVIYSHYLNSADLEHGRHFTALPTAYAAGFNVSGTNNLLIGSQAAWIAEDPQARAGFLEFSGKGLGHLQTGMTEKEKLMAILAGRMLESQPNSNAEATDTIRLRQSGEKSVLETISGSLSEMMTSVMQDLVEWDGGSREGVKITYSTDFDIIGISAQMLQSLFLLVQSGKLSYDTFFFNLRRGDLLPEGRTIEEEMKLIEQGGPDIEIELPDVKDEPNRKGEEPGDADPEPKGEEEEG